MAKKIRFPLKMKDGTDVRTLEDLREHFDLESVLGYFADGKLKTWLADRYYDEMAQKVAALSADMPDLNALLCGIIGVEYSAQEDDTDLEVLQRRQEKLRVLREVTDDQQILDNVDAVAFDQDELFDILDEAPSVIYLYGDKFSIPYAKGNITYIGINSPEVALEKNELEYKKNGILLNNVRFENESFSMNIQTAEELMNQEQYDEAFPIVQALAVSGDAQAQWLLGMMYHSGLGINENLDGAAEWYEKAAEQGNSNAQNALGDMYYNGNGVSQNFAFAVEWYREAAEQGNVRAQCNLGYMYEQGHGVSQNDVTAVEWYRKAAEQGYADAQYKLGNIYFHGFLSKREAPQDYYRVHEQESKIAAEWYRKAAEQGYARGQYMLAMLLEMGWGVKMDKPTAHALYQKAAEQGDPDGMFFLGCHYRDGECVPQDIVLAIEWFRKAAEQGHRYAQDSFENLTGFKPISFD